METKAIWNRYAEDIKRFIFTRVKDALVTDDLLQETFIKVHTKRQTLKDESKLKPWVFSIARFTVIDYFRQQKLSYKAIEEPIVSDVVFLENNDLCHTEHDCLQGIIKKLPKKYRTPLFLADIKGMKQGQVAKQLDLPLGTVKSQIQRARKLIAQGFMDCCGFKMNEDGFLTGEVKNRQDCKVCN